MAETPIPKKLKQKTGVKGSHEKNKMWVPIKSTI